MSPVNISDCSDQTHFSSKTILQIYYNRFVRGCSSELVLVDFRTTRLRNLKRNVRGFKLSEFLVGCVRLLVIILLLN